MPKTKPEIDQPQDDRVQPVVHAPPIDPGDAGGVGNGSERKISPTTLHEAIDPEAVPAREEALRLGRL